MLLLTAKQVDSVHDVTDSLGLKRGAIIVPLAASDVGSEIVMPDGNLLISAPYGARFNPWLAGLRVRLLGMNLVRTPRADQLEPFILRVPQRPQASGMRRYWDWREPSPRAPKVEVLPRPLQDDDMSPCEDEMDAMREFAVARDEA